MSFCSNKRRYDDDIIIYGYVSCVHF